MEIHLSESIRKLRKKAALTQEQLAEAMGVSVGAVSKWELGASIPDITTIMELADFFETSVDALLGYAPRSHEPKNTVEQLRLLRQQKRFAEGMTLAEKALQKYPNHFEIVYQSALIYHLTLDKRYVPRALELLERACLLIDQNPYESVSLLSIQNDIAGCYQVIENFDEALNRLKKNNYLGINDSHIGIILSMHYKNSAEALKYLTNALVHCYGELSRITLGLGNTYNDLGELGKAYDIMLLMHTFQRQLRGDGKVSSLDRDNVRVQTVLAQIAALQGKDDLARTWLRQARETALRFDAAPVYSMRDMKYYHSEEDAVGYDDFGETAMDGIRTFLADEGNKALRPIWEQMEKES